jgi:hypothetical protein
VDPIGVPASINKLDKLTSLVLLGASGEIPSTIGRLPKLKTLKFLYRNTGLKGSLPAELGDIAILEEFVLQSSGVVSEIPTKMGDLANLRVFDIGRATSFATTITGEVPASFARLSNLETFKIDGTGIVGPVPLLSETLTLTTCALTDQNCYQSANTVCAGNGAQGNCHTLINF